MIKIMMASCMMLASSFAFCKDDKKWEAEYLKVEYENLNLIDFKKNDENFKIGFFISPEQIESLSAEEAKEKEYDFNSGNLGYAISYQMRF